MNLTLMPALRMPVQPVRHTTGRVLALGSAHGDDRAAWLVTDRLKREQITGLKADIVSEPLAILNYLEDCKTLILLDACRTGGEPGTIHRLVWPDPRIQSDVSNSTHGFGVASVLAMAEALGRLPPRVVLLVIEADNCQPGDELSAALSSTLNDLYSLVLAETNQVLQKEQEM